MTLDETIADLRRKLAEATKGKKLSYGEPEVGLPHSLFRVDERGNLQPVEPLRGIDIDLVAAMWNTLPAILDALDARTKALSRLDPDVPENVERVVAALREQLFVQVKPGETLQDNQARAILRAIIGDGA